MKSSYLVLGAAIFSANLLFSLNSFAATEIYQWVDENGVRHFSQQPPAHMPGLKAVDVTGAPIVSEGEPQAPVVATKPEELEPQEPEVERVENPEKNATQCERARSNIKRLVESRRVRTKDPETGELRYLGDEEKEAQRKNWKDRESTYC